jgi:hypothetical protein
LATKRCASDEANAFLFGRQNYIGDVGIILTELNQPAMASVGHVADLSNADAAKVRIDCVGPRCL